LASFLLGCQVLAVQALRACGPARVSTCSMVTRGGVPSDEEQATGLEREIMMAGMFSEETCLEDPAPRATWREKQTTT
uniref:Uncharacterized protein n=1 Tax=Vombatus ursinus TaxID=29139 RepID=A0A4X2KHY6_VOMUR